MRSLARRVTALEGPASNEFSHLSDEELQAELDDVDARLEAELIAEQSPWLDEWRKWKERWTMAESQGDFKEMTKLTEWLRCKALNDA